MARTIEHRCPSCATVTATGRRASAAVGPPFLECPQCGGFVPHEPYEEWSTMRPGRRLQLVGAGMATALGIGLLPALVFGAVDLAAGKRSGVEAFLAVAVGGVVLSLAVWFCLLSRRIQFSARRMADPMYRAKLMEFSMATPGPASPVSSREG